MDANNVVNYNETLVWLSSKGQIRLEHAAKAQAQKKGPKGMNIGSLVSFIAANGTVLLLVWIFKAAPNQQQENETLHNNTQTVHAAFIIKYPTKIILRGQHPTLYAFTKLGYSNTTLNSNIMKHFGELWKRDNREKMCWLFGNELSCHKNVNMVGNALTDNVMCWLFPANCSHFLQPLDATAFACFKQEISASKVAGHICPNMPSNEYQSCMYEVAYEAEQHAFTKRVIERSFAKTGIFPWSTETILKLAKQNVGKVQDATQNMYVERMRRSVEAKLQGAKK